MGNSKAHFFPTEKTHDVKNRGDGERIGTRRMGLALAALAILLVGVVHVGFCSRVEPIVNCYRERAYFVLVGVATITTAVFIQEQARARPRACSPEASTG